MKPSRNGALLTADDIVRAVESLAPEEKARYWKMVNDVKFQKLQWMLLLAKSGGIFRLTNAHPLDYMHCSLCQAWAHLDKAFVRKPNAKVKQIIELKLSGKKLSWKEIAKEVGMKPDTAERKYHLYRRQFEAQLF
jgi:hypothetical protein